jgi:hypothetical protein
MFCLAARGYSTRSLAFASTVCHCMFLEVSAPPRAQQPGKPVRPEQSTARQRTLPSRYAVPTRAALSSSALLEPAVSQSSPDADRAQTEGSHQKIDLPAATIAALRRALNQVATLGRLGGLGMERQPVEPRVYNLNWYSAG